MFRNLNFSINYATFSKATKVAILFIVILYSIFSIFNSLNSSPIEKWDEKTNIDVVGNMDKDFFNPEYLNEPFLEKPPLWYWITYIFTKLLSNETYVFRLLSVFSFCGILILVFFICNKKFGFYPAITSLIVLLTTKQLFEPRFDFIFSTHSFRSADLDAYMIFLCLLSFYFLYKYISEKQLISYLIFGALFTGLAILAKGLLGVTPLLAFFGFYLINKQKICFKHILVLIVTLSIVLIPWHLYKFILFGNEFIREYIYYHNFQRSINGIENHNGNFFFYISILLDFRLFPFFIIFFLSFLQIKGKIFFQNKKLEALCLINIGIYLLIISLVQTKLAWYVLYLYPFIAIFIAGFIFEIIKKQKAAFK